MWDSLLKGLGSALGFFYDVIPSYGVAIILLTISVRVVLLPLTIKQTRSMQAMQRIQPQMKALQQKHKGNKQKLNEELMKLYKEHQVNPLGGCLPLILQLPVFFALFSVLRSAAPGLPAGTEHLPMTSALREAISTQSAGFLGMNLSCAATQAGRTVGGVDCGSGVAAYIPFYAMIVLMVATTWYQTRQMQAASPGQPRQAQLMGRIMPVFLGVISISIPAGVLVYWVTTNLWQVVQQRVMLKQQPAAKPAGAKAVAPPTQDGPQANPKPESPPPRKASRRARNRKKRRKR